MVEQETEEVNIEESKQDKGKSESGFNYHSSRFFSLIFLAIYIVAVAVFCLVYHIIPGPEFLVIGILFLAAYNKQTYRALKDWLPFIMIFLSYELMYSFIGTVSSKNVHLGPEILDVRLFGQVPSLILQETIKMPVLNYMGAFFYSIYFFVPTIFAFIVWKKSPSNYFGYTIAFGVLAYSALITYMFYPTAPPWMVVPNVTRILTGSVDPSIGIPVYKTLYDFLSSNEYAAFPSMHSAVPFLVFLFAYKIWKKKALPVLAIPVGTWFSAIYLGEHYFTDVVGGILYATVAYLAVVKVLPWMSKKSSFLQKHVPKDIS